MRRRVSLDDDMMAEIERLRRQHGMGLSEALNALARTGIAALPRDAATYEHRSANVGLRVDASNIGDVLDLPDEAG